jgi:hypothetical protein
MTHSRQRRQRAIRISPVTDVTPELVRQIPIANLIAICGTTVPKREGFVAGSYFFADDRTKEQSNATIFHRNESLLPPRNCPEQMDRPPCRTSSAAVP